MGCHIANNVVLVEYIASDLNSITMDATTDQGRVEKLMKTIYKLTETNQTLGKYIKKLVATNEIFVKQNQ